ncbi:MAG: hypothetical protein ABFD54_08450 [Armatimonadota bacterium]|nr:hypothetical protein [bacterium]
MNPSDHENPEIPGHIPTDQIEEYRNDPSFQKWFVGGWIAPILVVMYTVGWHGLMHGILHDRPRHWQYGVVPYVPAQSWLTTRYPPKDSLPKQVILPKKTTKQGGMRGGR